MIRRLRKVVRFSMYLLVVLVIAGVVLDVNLTRQSVLHDYPGRHASSSGSNWLIVGSDSRSSLSQQQQERLSTGGNLGTSRSDTILLVHIAGGSQVTVVSLPRDSYVRVPGEPERNKLNAAYAHGGAELLVQTVELATGMRIDHYVEIGFDGVAGLVDAMGGIDVCLEGPIADPLAGLQLEAGCQRIQGTQALGLTRSRATPRADLDRMNNQRMVVAAIESRMTSVSTVLNVFSYPALWQVVTHNLIFDANTHIWQCAVLIAALRGEVQSQLVPIRGFEDTSVGNVVIWDEGQAQTLFESLS